MEVRFRPRLRQLPWFSLVVPVLQLVAPPSVAALPRGFWVAVAAASVAAIAFRATRGVDLRPGALVVRGRRVREIPWSDVESMRKELRFGGRHVAVLAQGRTWRLAAPVQVLAGNDPDFDEKADTIWRYWQERRPVPVG